MKPISESRLESVPDFLIPTLGLDRVRSSVPDSSFRIPLLPAAGYLQPSASPSTPDFLISTFKATDLNKVVERRGFALANDGKLAASERGAYGSEGEFDGFTRITIARNMREVDATPVGTRDLS